MIKGLDISVAQPAMPWAKAWEEGFRFAIVRCAEGNNVQSVAEIGNLQFRDRHFSMHIDGAKDAGMVVGAYYVPFPLPHLDPIVQAQIFFDASMGLGTMPGELSPMIDFEWPMPEHWAKWKCTPPQLRAWGLAFLAEVKRVWSEAAGETIVPMVYEYPYFNAQLQDDGEVEYAQYEFVLANYKAAGRIPLETEWPAAPKPFREVVIWQSDGDGGLKLGGIDIDVDFIRNQDTLDRLARITPKLHADSGGTDIPDERVSRR